MPYESGTLLDAGFENGTDGATLDSGIWTVSGSPQKREYDTARAKMGTVSALIQGPTTAADSGVYMASNPAMTADGAEYRVWLYFDSTNQQRKLEDFVSGEGKQLSLVFDTAGNIVQYINTKSVTGYTADGLTILGTYAVGWMQYRVVYNFTNDTFTLSRRAAIGEPWVGLKASGAADYNIPLRGENNHTTSQPLQFRGYQGANLWLDDVRYSNSGIIDTPSPITATVVDATHTDITFDMSVASKEAAAETVGNWSCSHGVAVSAAVLQANTAVVRLTHTALAPSTEYTFTAGNAITGSGDKTAIMTSGPFSTKHFTNNTVLADSDPTGSGASLDAIATGAYGYFSARITVERRTVSTDALVTTIAANVANLTGGVSGPATWDAPAMGAVAGERIDVTVILGLGTSQSNANSASTASRRFKGIAGEGFAASTWSVYYTLANDGTATEVDTGLYFSYDAAAQSRIEGTVIVPNITDAPATDFGLAASVSGHVATLNWASSGGSTGHKVYRSTASDFTIGAGNLIATIGDVGTYVDTTTEHGAFGYKVVATNAFGSSSPTPVVAVAVGAQTVTPSVWRNALVGSPKRWGILSRQKAPDGRLWGTYTGGHGGYATGFMTSADDGATWDDTALSGSNFTAIATAGGIICNGTTASGVNVGLAINGTHVFLCRSTNADVRVLSAWTLTQLWARNSATDYPAAGTSNLVKISDGVYGLTLQGEAPNGYRSGLLVSDDDFATYTAKPLFATGTTQLTDPDIGTVDAKALGGNEAAFAFHSDGLLGVAHVRHEANTWTADYSSPVTSPFDDAIDGSVKYAGGLLQFVTLDGGDTWTYTGRIRDEVGSLAPWCFPLGGDDVYAAGRFWLITSDRRFTYTPTHTFQNDARAGQCAAWLYSVDAEALRNDPTTPWRLEMEWPRPSATSNYAAGMLTLAHVTGGQYITAFVEEVSSVAPNADTFVADIDFGIDNTIAASVAGQTVHVDWGAGTAIDLYRANHATVTTADTLIHSGAEGTYADTPGDGTWYYRAFVGATGSNEVSAEVREVLLNAEASVAAQADAALIVAKLLTADAAASSTADAALLVLRSLAAEGFGSAVADAVLLVARNLAAEGDVSATAGASLGGMVLLAAEGAAATIADAALTVRKWLGAEGVVSAAADAGLDVLRSLAAEVAGSVSADAGLVVAKLLAAEGSVGVTANGSLDGGVAPFVRRIGHMTASPARPGSMTASHGAGGTLSADAHRTGSMTPPEAS